MGCLQPGAAHRTRCWHGNKIRESCFTHEIQHTKIQQTGIQHPRDARLHQLALPRVKSRSGPVLPTLRAADAARQAAHHAAGGAVVSFTPVNGPSATISAPSSGDALRSPQADRPDYLAGALLQSLMRPLKRAVCDEPAQDHSVRGLFIGHRAADSSTKQVASIRRPRARSALVSHAMAPAQFGHDADGLDPAHALPRRRDSFSPPDLLGIGDRRGGSDHLVRQHRPPD